MSEMVDRIAKKMTPLLGEAPARWEVNIPLAQILIEEMRVPTEAMTACGYAHDNVGSAFARRLWREMIDEALR